MLLQVLFDRHRIEELGLATWFLPDNDSICKLTRTRLYIPGYNSVTDQVFCPDVRNPPRVTHVSPLMTYVGGTFQ
jgi:hypothetical protein